ncbi:MAG: hypothetical protein IJ724_01050 [Muribaculaceae bacterium]|nr:hypothetical protein [Muribaculaceae bacterium]
MWALNGIGISGKNGFAPLFSLFLFGNPKNLRIFALCYARVRMLLAK